MKVTCKGEGTGIQEYIILVQYSCIPVPLLFFTYISNPNPLNHV